MATNHIRAGRHAVQKETRRRQRRDAERELIRAARIWAETTDSREYAAALRVMRLSLDVINGPRKARPYAD